MVGANLCDLWIGFGCKRVCCVLALMVYLGQKTFCEYKGSTDDSLKAIQSVQFVSASKQPFAFLCISG